MSDISFYPPITEPNINFNHVDGPYCTRRDGAFRWLTRWERVMVFLGFWDAWTIEKRPSCWWPEFKEPAQ